MYAAASVSPTYMCPSMYVCMKERYNTFSMYHSQSYLVLQVLRLLLLVVATVDTPDKVMEVVLEELLTVSLTH